jgi:hypothetical protein
MGHPRIRRQERAGKKSKRKDCGNKDEIGDPLFNLYIMVSMLDDED